jgi:transposase InsO family protein
MANRVIGDIAKQEVREAMRGLSGAAAKAEAARWADLLKVKTSHIYKITKDLREGLRKPRADKGKRTYQLAEGTDVWTAAQLVIVDKLDPDHALQTVQLRNPQASLPSLEYFRQMLAEKGLGKKARRIGRRAYRQWEAEHPGEIFQVDVTALKVRWQDENTRRIHRIDGIDKNHPMQDESKIRVWQIMLVDDHSRRRFLRYVATRNITSRDMVRFECEAFDQLGVPKTLYTDNGSEFKGHHIQAEKLLNRFLEDMGGYRHQTHAPNNPQATGKVEGAHKWAEKMDRLIGLAVTEGQKLSIEDLNVIADRFCEHYNNQKHRATGQTPMERWHSKRIVVRKIERSVIESALLTQAFPAVLDASMTVACGKEIYKVPGVAPFVNFVGQKVQVLVPPSIDVILMALPDGSEYEIEKMLATADKAGEFRSTADSTAETLKKRLRATRKEEVKEIKTKQKQTGQIAPVPHVNTVVEIPVTNVTQFPQPEHVVSAEEVGKVVMLPTTPAVTHASGAGHIPEYEGKSIGYWEAVAEFADRFENMAEAKEFMLGLFPNMEGNVPSVEVDNAERSRHAVAQRMQLRRVS